mmetsp:Transcript_112278/g.312054  ORF Transcript_112278/g.312054 Transcript_112278/m.312054 type:complete len:100 (+) Transcript_112278:374-673(+)
MYPQSLQTHSPCQYFSSSSGCCSFDFRFPKTFKLVVVDDDDDLVMEDGARLVVVTTAEGRTENAWVVDPARQMIATIKERRNDFMIGKLEGRRESVVGR